MYVARLPNNRRNVTRCRVSNSRSNTKITRIIMLAGALVALLLLASPQSDLAHAQTQADETVEYAEGRTDAVATFTATDPDGTRVVWSLDGTDKDVFAINTGVLTFLKSPDFEAPGDVAGGTTAAEDNIYEVTVKATDETMKVGMKKVMVTVTNVDEAGTVSLSARRPQSATAFTAEISDPDGATAPSQMPNGSGPNPVPGTAPMPT